MSPQVAAILLQTQADHRLLELASTGSEQAFETLVKRYRKQIQRYCGHLLPKAPAEDVAQQTFMATWESLQKGVRIQNLRAWLYRTAHNKALNTVTKAGYQYEELGESLTVSSEPAEEAARRTKVRSAFSALADLPEHQREALLQTAVQGRSHNEVAYALGISDGAVRQLVARARKYVRTAAAAFLPFPWIAKAAGIGAGISEASLAERVRAILMGPDNHRVRTVLTAAAIAVIAAVLLADPLGDHSAKERKTVVSQVASSSQPAQRTQQLRKKSTKRFAKETASAERIAKRVLVTALPGSSSRVRSLTKRHSSGKTTQASRSTKHSGSTPSSSKNSTSQGTAPPPASSPSAAAPSSAAVSSPSSDSSSSSSGAMASPAAPTSAPSSSSASSSAPSSSSSSSGAVAYPDWSSPIDELAPPSSDGSEYIY